jgi:hypothetical protein
MEDSMRITCLLVIGLLATGICFPKEGVVLFYDDFSDGNLGAWAVYVPGWYELNGVLHGTNTWAMVRSEAVYLNGFGWTDYSAEVDVTPLGDYRPADVELNVRYNDPTHTCICALHQSSNPAVGDKFLWVYVPGMSEFETPLAPFQFSSGTTYRLRATVHGQTATCEVIGYPETKLSLTRADIPAAGTVAIRNTHIPADFDNLIVRAIQKTPTELITELVAKVVSLNLQHGISNSLDAKLGTAVKALDDINLSNNVAAINAMEAFINAVEAQRDDKIPAADADTLIETARQIIVLLQSGA